MTIMTKLIFATGNRGKLREAQEILGEEFGLATPAEMGLEEDIPETGTTIRANSLQKAEYIRDHLGADCFADDTGLEVDILGGQPGVMTARYGGPGKDPAANMDRLLKDMALREKEASMARDLGLTTARAGRKARFRTVVTLIRDGKIRFFDGTLEGRIARTRAGEGGFGYDPVFIPDEIPGPDGILQPNTENLTLAELGEEAKNAISHRGKALRAMAAFLHEKTE